MSSSNVNPQEIEPDMGSISPDGHIDVLIHWNITESDGVYTYEEERVNRQLPPGIRYLSDITTYLTSIKDQLFRIVGAPAPSDEQWKSDIELALLDLVGA